MDDVDRDLIEAIPGGCGVGIEFGTADVCRG
jgi:hypothetical protein